MLGLSGEPCGAGGVVGDDFVYVAVLGVGAALEEGIAGVAVEEALIDDPGEGLDAGAAEVCLQGGGLVHGGGLGEGDEEDVGVGGITQALEEAEDFFGLGTAGVALELALIGLAGIEEETGVAGGCWGARWAGCARRLPAVASVLWGAAIVMSPDVNA